MERDELIFNLIVQNAVYAFLKEKYKNSKIANSDDSKNIKILVEHLLDIDKYSHIPDKELIVKKEYENIKSLINSEEFRESVMLNKIKSESKELTLDEKNSILLAVIHIMHADKKVSKVEKSIIQQIIKFLDLSLSYDDAIKLYKSQSYKKQKFPIFALIVGLFIILGSVAGVYLLYKKKTNVNTLFEKSELAFSRVYFDRFVIYQNKFATNNSHFQKLAVYKINGYTDVSFDAKSIEYNPLTKTIIYKYNKPTIFNTSVHIKTQLIDKIDPKSITEKEAQKLAIFVGIAGAYAGGKAGVGIGGMIGKFLPPQYAIISTIAGGGIGGVLAGGTGYFLTNKALNGLSLSKDISKKEESEVIQTAKELIKVQTSVDSRLQDRYKKNFEEYIKNKFANNGFKIEKVTFKKAEK